MRPESSVQAGPRSNTQFAAAIALAMLVVACGPSYRTIDAPELNREERRLAFKQRVQLFRLGNGLVVALVPERGTNLVTVDMRYRFGAAEDPEGKAGMAHLAEHLLFAVRRAESGPSIADTLGKSSLYHNAFTNWDETHYTATALSSQVATLVQTEHLRLTAGCVGISDAVFQRERQVVLQELLQRRAAAGDAPTQIRRSLFGREHPYTRSVGGTPADVGGISKDEACAFIKERYAPHEAILVVSGDFDSARLRGLVGGLFGAVPKRKTPWRREVSSLEKKPPATVGVDGEQSAVMFAFRAEPWGSHTHTVRRMLGGLVLTALQSRVRDSKTITGVSFEHIGGYRGGADAFVLWFDKAPNRSEAKKLYEAARDDALKYMDAHSVTRLINRSQLMLLKTAEPFTLRAQLVADYLQYRTDNTLMVGELRRIGRLTKDYVQDAADKSFFLRDASVVVMEGKGATGVRHERVPVTVDTKELDFETWREPVDETEAQRSLAVPNALAPPKRFEHTLANGLRVVLVPELSHPVVDVQLVLPVGSDRDPTNRKGLSGLAATMLSVDNEKQVEPGTLRTVRFVDSMASRLQSHVGDQITTFRGTGLASNVDGLLWQLHQWVKRGVYDKARLSRLGKRMAERPLSKRQRTLRRLAHHLATAVYGAGHPYVPPEQHARRLTVGMSDLRSHRRRHFGMRGATLIIAGRFDARDVAGRIKRLFGSMPAGPKRPSPPPIPAARPSQGPTFVSFIDEEAAQPSVLLVFPQAPGVTAGRAARAVLVEILRQRMTQIRSRYGATYGITVQQSRRRGPGALFITGQLDPNRGDKALLAMTTVLSELRQGKDLARDFVRARRRVFGRLLATTADSGAVAASLRYAAAHQLPADHRYRLAREVAQLRPEAIRALIGSELSAGRTFGLVAGPRKMIGKIYRTAGIKPSRELE